MSEDVSRRKALSLLALGGALGFTLSATLEPSEAEAATAEVTGTVGMERRHTRRTSGHQRPAVQPAAAPTEAAPAECKPTSQSQYYMCQYK
jgi:hypothetical protein